MEDFACGNVSPLLFGLAEHRPLAYPHCRAAISRIGKSPGHHVNRGDVRGRRLLMAVSEVVTEHRLVVIHFQYEPRPSRSAKVIDWRMPLRIVPRFAR